MTEKKLICGLDEAGRGPLAGPVVAACVHIPPEEMNKQFWSGVTDSKKLSAKRREELFQRILDHAVCGIAQSSVAEIDDINILQASLQAMKRSFDTMHALLSLDYLALIDGNQTPKNMTCATRTVVKGDSKHLEIAAASILAKVTRDRIMQQLHIEFPYYGWDTNAGYGSAKHMAAIQQYGVTQHHRRSFSPVRAALSS